MKFRMHGLLLLLLWGCAGNRPVISGDFGEIVPPNQDQVAVVRHKGGDSTIAYGLQAEDDTLFMQTLDFSIVPLPLDSVSGIDIRSKSPLEMTGSENKAIEKQAKNAATEAGIRGAIWLVVVVPALVLGWVASRLLATASD